jgi:prophage antirepressor-like protein
MNSLLISTNIVTTLLEHDPFIVLKSVIKLLGINPKEIISIKTDTEFKSQYHTHTHTNPRMEQLKWHSKL